MRTVSGSPGLLVIKCGGWSNVHCVLFTSKLGARDDLTLQACTHPQSRYHSGSDHRNLKPSPCRFASKQANKTRGVANAYILWHGTSTPWQNRMIFPSLKNPERVNGHTASPRESSAIESCHTSVSYGSTYRGHSVSRFQNDSVLVNHQDAPWPRIF